MQFTVPVESFRAAVAAVAAVVETRSSIPIIQNLRLDAQPCGIILTGTDLEIGIRTVVLDADITDPGSHTLPAKALKNILATVSGSVSLSFTPDSPKVFIKNGTSSFKLEGLPVDSFPTLPTGSGDVLCTLPAEALSRAITLVLPGISTEQSRFTLNAALIDQKDGELRFVSTDGHRLALYRYPLEAPDFRMLAGRSTLEWLARNLKTGSVVLARIPKDETSYFTMYRHGDSLTEFIARNVTGNFPDYERVIPKIDEETLHLTVRREDLLGALNKIAKFLDTRSRTVEFDPTNGDTLAVRNCVSGDDAINAEVTIPIREHVGTPAPTGWNAKYIIEFLRAVPDADLVTLHYKPALAATLSADSEPNYTYVVMPMRINAVGETKKQQQQEAEEEKAGAASNSGQTEDDNGTH